MMNIPCTKCGACCRVLPEWIAKTFNLPISESGGCGHLGADNSCAIFDSRPGVCRTEWVYENVAKPQGKTEEQFYDESVQSCKDLGAYDN